MVSVRSVAWIDASGAEVWALVRDSERLPEWVSGVASCRVDGDRRVCVLSTGAELEERVVTLDDELRRLEYEVLAGLPADEHRGTVDVIEDGAERCLVVYSTWVEPARLARGLQRSTDGAVAGLVSVFVTNQSVGW
ncbi:MAG: hypothetical protein JWO46_137 [Nocardioidaceae bacterium]|nr:hypothetical protein [Nocardioidaceae bacterium]